MNYDTSEIGENVVDLEHASKTLLSLNQTAWTREAETKPKLRTFNQIHDFNTYQTLVQTPVTRIQRSFLSQLKFGILPLKIETDRYQGIKPENRLCKLCNLNEPEDEIHFIFRCPALSEGRLSVTSHINLRNISLTTGSEIPNLRLMFQKENISSFAIYLERLYKTRQKLIYG